MAKKTKLLSEVELSRIESNKIEDISEEADEYLGNLIEESLWDLLAIASLNYMDNNKTYDYQDDWQYYNEDDENQGITCLGEFNPANYETIYDFLNSFNGEVDEREEWGETYYEALTIESEIQEEIYNLILERLDMFAETFLLEQQNHSDWLFQTCKITTEEKRKHLKTGEETSRITATKKKMILNHPISKKEMATFLEKYLDGYPGLDLNDLIYNWIEEVSDQSFQELYLHGCKLLNKKPKIEFRLIRFSGTSIQKMFYQALFKKLVKDEMFKKSLRKNLPYRSGNKQELLKQMKKNEVLNLTPTLKGMLTECLYSIVLDKMEQPIESILQLMAAIYAYQYNELSNVPIAYQSDELEHFLSYPEIQEALLTKGLEYCYEILYEELKVKDNLKETLPEEPKDYYPEARQLNRHFILHVGETNTGKTYQSLERLKQAQTGVYLAPLRLLALEVQEQMNQQGIPCHLITGEEELFIEKANHIACTIEKLNLYETYEVAVIDEGQMIGDDVRGGAWTSAILGVCAKEIHICLAPYALELIQQLIQYCEDTFEVIHHYRDSELELSAKRFNFLSEVEPGDAIVVFSKRKVLNVAAKLMKDKKLPCSLLYGALPYQSRAKQFQDFFTGKTSILVTTDAVGMGVNLPIKRVILLEDSKYDGKQMRALTTSELKQIGGRAGRKGIYETGEVIFPNKKTQTEFLKQPTSLTVAPLGLTPHLLTMKEDLMETVNGWKKLSFGPLFKQVDLSQNIQLLQKANSLGLSKEEQYKAMFLPVNLSNTSQSNLLSVYFIHLKNGTKCVPLPEKPPLRYGDTLNQLEDYYKLLDLYYAFSKTYQLQYEANFIREEREKVSEAINQHLLSKELKVATCSECGKEMAWDSYYYKCDRCYHNHSSYYRYSYGYDFDDNDEDEYFYGY